jgi:cation:H+ antiporter
VIAQLLVFIIALALLLLSARFFTAAAERIGLALGLSSFVVGVLIVGIGTSLPELVASLVSVSRGDSEIVSGNVIGSNISNLLLILGATAVSSKLAHTYLGEEYIAIDLNFLVASAFMIVMVFLNAQTSFVEGVFLLVTYGVYVAYLLGSSRKEDQITRQNKTMLFDVLIVLGCAIGIYFGADYTVSSLQGIASGLGVPSAIVAVTLLSLGTTLPELVVSVTAARSGKLAMATGNILGSCIFNALVVLGASSMAGGVSVPPAIINIALPFLAGSTLLFYLLTQDKRISRYEGLLFVVLYGLFIASISGLV